MFYINIQKCFVLLLALIFLNSCSEYKEHKFTELHLGTTFEIKIVDKNSDDEKIKEIVKKSFDLVKDYEQNYFSIYSDKSELSLINQKLQNIKKTESNDYVSFTPSIKLMELFKIALEVSKITNWNFDISYKSALKGKNVIKIVSKNVLIKNKTFLDTGGVAKGYIVDLIAKFLKKNKINNFIINAGGDIAVSGNKKGKAWIISILNPKNLKSQIGFCRFLNKNISIVTSGSYFRYKIINGEKISHIIDPKKNKTSQSDLSSITIIYKNTAMADAFATGFYVQGYNQTKQKFDYLDKQELGVIIANADEFALNKTAQKYCEVKYSK